MILKINTYNQLKALAFLLRSTAYIIVALFFLRFDSSFLIGFAIMYPIFTGPSLFMHVEYYLANKGQEITIENDEFTLMEKNGNFRKYRFSEFRVVILYMSAIIDTKGIQIAPMDSYYFARIITTSGEQIIITCLMCPELLDMVNHLKGVEHLRVKPFLCTLSTK